MEPVFVGWLSLLPPIIAIGLALITKEVISSLMIGILSGALIYALNTGLNPVVGVAETTFKLMAGRMDVNILLFLALLGALVVVMQLAGSVFGDHCSPISDTTILSSTGAGCNHIEHVSTQMVYALTVAVCCFFGYIVAGLTGGNIPITLGVSIVLLLGALFVLHRLFANRGEKQAA